MMSSSLLRMLVWVAICSGPSFVFGAATYLDAAEIEQIAPCRFSGTYYEPEATIGRGELIAGEMTAGGTFFMKWSGGRWPAGRFDKARWWTEGGKWCRQFVELSQAKPVCYSVRRDGLEYVFVNANGAAAFVLLCDALSS